MYENGSLVRYGVDAGLTLEPEITRSQVGSMGNISCLVYLEKAQLDGF